MTDYFSYTLDPDAIRAISSIGLAHLGDAVYELLVRTYCVRMARRRARDCTARRWSWSVRRSRRNLPISFLMR